MTSMRAYPKIIALTAIGALGLVACNNAGGARANGKVCMPFATAQAAALDPSATVDDCLHRWAYSLAPSSDEAEQVAKAAVAACASTMTRWNQSALSPDAPAVEAPSLMTGQPTTPIAEHMNYAQGRALLYVVQARAGKCAPPPAATTTTTTTTAP
jgi:hypothetical protein